MCPVPNSVPIMVAQLASQLLQLPEAQRASVLNELLQENRTLHGMVASAIQRIRDHASGS